MTNPGLLGPTCTTQDVPRPSGSRSPAVAAKQDTASSVRQPSPIHQPRDNDGRVDLVLEPDARGARGGGGGTHVFGFPRVDVRAFRLHAKFFGG